jgi:hypothetical protein
MVLIWHPPTLLRAINSVLRAVGGWTEEDLARAGRLAAIARALECPCPVDGDAPPAERLAWHCAALCEEVLSIKWLPERPRVAELLLRMTLQRSKTGLLVPELTPSIELQRFERQSRPELEELATFFYDTLEDPCVFAVDEVDWEAELRVRERSPEAYAYVREPLPDWLPAPYWLPTWYVGGLSEVPEADRAVEHAAAQVGSVLEAVMRQSPCPTDVALARSVVPFGATSLTPQPPGRADAHVVVATPNLSSLALEHLHAVPGPKILLERHGSDSGPAEHERPIEAVSYSHEAPVSLARWLDHMAGRSGRVGWVGTRA